MGFMQYVTLMSLMPSAFCIREVLLVHLGVDSYRPLHAALNDTRVVPTWLVIGRAPSSAQLQLTKVKSTMGTAFLGCMLKCWSLGSGNGGPGDRDWDGSALRLSPKHGNNALSPHIQ